MKSWDSNCKVELTQLKMEKVSNINSYILNLSSENNHKCRNSKRKVLGSSSDKAALDGDEKNPNYSHSKTEDSILSALKNKN